MEEKANLRIERIFPDYFKRFKLPEGAHDESIEVYRACKSNNCDEISFMPSYEENGYKTVPLLEENDPSQYSLSTYENPKHVKRFTMIRPDYPEPCKVAIGHTNPIHGPIQRTKERTGNKRNSHVDWWLYKDAKPYLEFKIIDDFAKYFEDYRKEGEDKK